MMTSPVAGVDPRQDTLIVDTNGVERAHETFPTTSTGYLDQIDILAAHGVDQVGV